MIKDLGEDPGPSWTIKHDGSKRRDFPYVILDPRGYFVGLAMTLWGAKRIMRKEQRKRRQRTVVVYREPENEWLSSRSS